MSAVYISNKTGLIGNPCGKPELTLKIFDFHPSNCIWQCLDFSIAKIHGTITLDIPILVIFVANLPKSTQALWRENTVSCQRIELYIFICVSWYVTAVLPNAMHASYVEVVNNDIIWCTKLGQVACCSIHYSGLVMYIWEILLRPKNWIPWFVCEMVNFNMLTITMTACP